MKLGCKERERPKKARKKRHKASQEKRARKLERTPKQAEYDETNAEENTKRHKLKGEYLAKSNVRRKYKEL